jgi:predicted phosphodiesterase
MRYAVISDIHGNLEALNAVLKDIKRRGADVTVCLGDIVGYYPDPKRCIELVSSHVNHCVAGNHDYAAIGKTDTSCFTYFAYSALEWTKQHLSDFDKEFLNGLPLTFERDGILFTHSSPCEPERFAYVFPDNEYSVFEAFNSLSHRVTFIGHTHWASIMFQEDDKVILHSDNCIDIDENCVYLVNVGSVGQPRDFDNRSCYAIYDTEEQKVSLHRVSYNFRVTQRKIKENGLHIFLAERLERGR